MPAYGWSRGNLLKMIYQASVLGFEGGHNTDVQHDSHKETEGSNERTNNEAPGFSSIALPKLVQLNQCSPRRRLSTWLVRPVWSRQKAAQYSLTKLTTLRLQDRRFLTSTPWMTKFRYVGLK